MVRRHRITGVLPILAAAAILLSFGFHRPDAAPNENARPNTSASHRGVSPQSSLEAFQPVQQEVRLSPSPVSKEGAAGHPSFYVLTVTNIGSVAASYELSFTGHTWPVTLLNEDSTTKITVTPELLPGKLTTIVVQVDIPASQAPGAVDTLRVYARSTSDSSVFDYAFVKTLSAGAAASLPFVEQFSEGFLNTTRWTTNNGPARVRTNALNAPSPPYTLNFDGANTAGDSIISQPIDLHRQRDVSLQFWYQRGGAANAPEPGDDFFVEYYNFDGEWLTLVVLPGAGPIMTEFAKVSLILPVDAYHSSFRLRFRNIATAGPFDDWFLDDVNIAAITPGILPFADAFPGPVLDSAKWPFNAGAAVNTLALNIPSPPFALNLSGGDVVQSMPIDLSFQNSVSLRYEFQQTGTIEEPDSRDDLLIEFRDAGHNWTELARHLGSEGGLPFFTHSEVVLPPSAYHRNFSLRLRNVGSVDFDDWFVDDLVLDVFAPANIRVAPSALNVQLFEGDVATRTLDIQNLGVGDLFYRLRLAPSGSQAAFLQPAAVVRSKYSTDFYRTSLRKGEYDNRAGQAQMATRGGPDAYGYTWVSSDDAAGPRFAWEDIAAVGTPLTGLGDDDNVGPFEIGFAFPFYDSVYTTFRFCTNGFISFTSRSAAFNNTPLPGSSVGSLAAPFWDDLDASAAAVHILSDSSKLIVQWKNLMRVGGGGPYTFQLVLRANGAVEFRYLQIGELRSFATVGMQNQRGDEGLEIVFNAPFVKDSLVVQIARPASWVLFKPPSGQLPSNAQQSVRMNLSAVGLTGDSTYATMLHVRSNDFDQPVVEVPLTLAVFAIDDSTSHFPPTDTTGRTVYPIVIERATIDDVPLAAGDEIGVYTTLGAFAGAVVWQNGKPVRLLAVGDHPQTAEADGFAPGETIYFRIWDSSNGNNDYHAEPAYVLGDGRFGTGDSAVVSLLAALTSHDKDMMLASKWSWISLNVTPVNSDMAAVFGGITQLRIAKDGDGRVYIPGIANTIPAFNPLDGYSVYLDAPEPLTVTGEEVPPFTPIVLEAGWNFVSYLPLTAITAPAALHSIVDHLAIAKDDQGNVFIPELDNLNTIGMQQPGKGYKLYLYAADTLIYPIAEPNLPHAFAKSAPLAASSRAPKHFQIVERSSESYVILITAATCNGATLRTGDEIAVYDAADRLAGATVWHNEAPVVLVAWRAEEAVAARSTDISGYAPGTAMRFVVWQAETNSEVKLQARFTQGDGTFEHGAFAVVDLQGGEVPRSFALEQNYPNPFHLGGAHTQQAHTTIRYALPRDSHVTLHIYNMLGQIVRTLKDEPQPPGFHTLQWDGRNDRGNAVATGIYFYRLRAADFEAVRKLVVM